MTGTRIETPRLVLRVPTASDRVALHAMWADPRVMADLGPVKSAPDSDAALARHDGYRHEGLGFLAVIRREDEAMLGFCGLKRGNDGTPIAGEVEAGWMIAADHWGAGYAPEAMRAALDWGWRHTEAPRIVAITSRRNARSRALMEKLGMTHRGAEDFVHPAFAADDPLAPTVTYAIDRA